MTYKQLYDLLNNYLEGEDHSALYSAADRALAINTAYIQCTEKEQLNIKTVKGTPTLSAVAPDRYYFIPKPADFMAIGNDGVLFNGLRLRGITTPDAYSFDVDYADAAKQRTTGRTPVYYIEDIESGDAVNEIRLMPFTSSAELSYLLRYNARPADLTADTDLPWGGRFEPYHEVIPLLAASKLYKTQGKDYYQTSRYYLAEYDEAMSRLTRMKKRSNRTPVRLKIGHQR